jgi:hypothetical protein
MEQNAPTGLVSMGMGHLGTGRSSEAFDNATTKGIPAFLKMHPFFPLKNVKLGIAAPLQSLRLSACTVV